MLHKQLQVLDATLEVVKNVKFDGNYRYTDNLYAAIDPVKFYNSSS